MAVSKPISASGANIPRSVCKSCSSIYSKQAVEPSVWNRLLAENNIQEAATQDFSWSANDVAITSFLSVLFDSESTGSTLKDLIAINRSGDAFPLFINNPSGLVESFSTSTLTSGYIMLNSGESIQIPGPIRHVGVIDLSGVGAPVMSAFGTYNRNMNTV